VKCIEIKNEVWPLVTIVTVVYNLVEAGRTQTFLQCVESVRNQDYPNLEHIVIDGLSDDGTIALVKDYVKKGWVKLFSQKDVGIYDAMNKGIMHASGRYIAFLNSDDYYVEQKVVRRSVEALERSGASFSYATALIDRGEKKAKYFKPRVGRVLTHTPFPHPTMFIRNECFDQVGGFNTEFKIAADHDLMLRLILSNYKGIRINAVLTCFREGGVSHQTKEKIAPEIASIIHENLGSTEGFTYGACMTFASRRYIPFWAVAKICCRNGLPYKYRILMGNFCCVLSYWRKVVFNVRGQLETNGKDMSTKSGTGLKA
jgi:glycosyltransferase involved in cell wall biosynthesis